MAIVALDRVSLITPLGDQGDRNIQGISTALASDEWHVEADYHLGRIGDVILFRNTSANTKNAAPTWKYHCAIPAANIKSYRLAGEPPPAAAPKFDEPQTATPKAPARTGASAD